MKRLLLLALALPGCSGAHFGRIVADAAVDAAKNTRALNRSIDSRGYLNMKRPKLELTEDGRSWRIAR